MIRSLKASGLFFLFLLFVGCNNQFPTQYESHTTEVSDSYQADTAIQSIISPYKDSLDAQMNRVIGVFATEMKKAKPESRLGNFMCDATQDFYSAMYGGGDATADLTLMNYGGIRLQHIPAGDFTVQTMFELMPFENEVVLVDIPGPQMKRFFERIAQMNGWPVSNNIRMVIDRQNIESLMVNGEPFSEEKTYSVLMSDYVANGGDGLTFLEDLPRKRIGLKLRDVLIAYAEWKTEQGEEITAPITGRITLK